MADDYEEPDAPDEPDGQDEEPVNYYAPRVRHHPHHEPILTPGLPVQNRYPTPIEAPPSQSVAPLQGRYPTPVEADQPRLTPPSPAEAGPVGALNLNMRTMLEALPQSMRQQFLYDQVRLSQAEAVRLQKLRNQMGAIKADPNLTDEEKGHLMTQLQTGINPLALRQQEAKAMQIQQQAEQAKMQTSMIAQNMKAAQEIIQAEPDKRLTATNMPGKPNRLGQFDPKTGKYEFIRDHEAELELKQQQHMAETLQKQQHHEDEMELAHAEKDEKLWHAEYGKIEKEIQHGLELGEADPKLPGAIHGEWHKKQGIENPRAHFAAERMKERGFAATAEEYVQQQAEKRKGRRTNEQGDIGTASLQRREGKDNGQPAGASAAPPPGRVNAPQPAAHKNQDDAFDAALKTLRASNRSAPEKSYYEAQIQLLRELIATHGPVDTMPPGPIRNRALTAMTILENATTTPRQQARPLPPQNAGGMTGSSYNR